MTAYGNTKKRRYEILLKPVRHFCSHSSCQRCSLRLIFVNYARYRSICAQYIDKRVQTQLGYLYILWQLHKGCCRVVKSAGAKAAFRVSSAFLTSYAHVLPAFVSAKYHFACSISSAKSQVHFCLCISSSRNFPLLITFRCTYKPCRYTLKRRPY
jgi:hypothetical protein